MKKNKLKNKSLIIKFLCGSFAFVGALCLFLFGGSKVYAYELNNDGDLVSQNLINISASVASGMPDAAASEVLINEGAENYNYKTYVILPTKYNNVSLDPYVVLARQGSTGPEALDLNNSHYETVVTSPSSYDHLFQLYSINMTEQQGAAVDVAFSHSDGYTGPVAISFDYALIRFSYNNATRYGYAFYNIMISETSYNLPYEAPGAVYYASQESTGSYRDGYEQGYNQGYDVGFNDGSTDSNLYNFLKDSYGALYSNHNSSVVVPREHINLTNGALEATLENFENVYSYCTNSSSPTGGYYLIISLNEEKTLPFTVSFFNLLSSNTVSLSDASGKLLKVYEPNDIGYCFVNPDGNLSYQYIMIKGISLPDLNHDSGFFRLSIGMNSLSYLNGYNEGYKYGQLSGSDLVNEAHDKGYNDGFAVGKEAGYSQAINEGVNDNGFRTLFGSILSYPVNMIRSAFNFEIFGLNVSSLLMFIASIAVVGFVIKKFWK